MAAYGLEIRASGNSSRDVLLAGQEALLEAMAKRVESHLAEHPFDFSIMDQLKPHILIAERTVFYLEGKPPVIPTNDFLSFQRQLVARVRGDIK